MSKGKGFSLAELLITVLILAVLAGLAIPSFFKSKERAAANQAIAYLRTIRTSERMYYSRWGTYAGFPNSDSIKAHLGAETLSDHYDFEVNATSAGAFVAKATKKGTGETILLKEDGSWNGTSSYKPSS